jgi:hypothetical protein
MIRFSLLKRDKRQMSAEKQSSLNVPLIQFQMMKRRNLPITQYLLSRYSHRASILGQEDKEKLLKIKRRTRYMKQNSMMILSLSLKYNCVHLGDLASVSGGRMIFMLITSPEIRIDFKKIEI